jgi:UDP-galactopyranose mutase
MKAVVAIAGAGFAGAVLARELANSGDYHIVVFDERPHVAGNCYTRRDESTGILLHQYGPHIFNTSREDVWNYVNLWTPFEPFVNRVKAVTARGIYSLPINLLTINQFFNQRLDPDQARSFVAELSDRSIGEAKSFEEQALSMLGRELYENFFYGYTKKQWGVEPSRLPASILKRLPVRFNYNDNYYDKRYQGIPREGYTVIVERLLDHPEIEVHLNQRFEPKARADFSHLFWSGPMDAYFGWDLGRLRYRTLLFERFDGVGDLQGNPVINYCEEKIPYTRVTEHKHFAPWEEHAKTVCFREYSKATEPGDVPYYPLRLNDDKEVLNLYVARAMQEKGVSFIGRLGTYRYLDMDAVIGESLGLAGKCLGHPLEEWPRFSASV